jgi:hypothetical protein
MGIFYLDFSPGTFAMLGGTRNAHRGLEGKDPGPVPLPFQLDSTRYFQANREETRFFPATDSGESEEKAGLARRV